MISLSSLRATVRLCVLFIVPVLSSCADDEPNSIEADIATSDASDVGPTVDVGADSDVTDDATEVSSIAEQLGVTRYSGTITARELSTDGNVTTYEFDPAEGPVCLRGAPFRTAVRDTESEDLVIFLQGGGACWSTFCLAVTAAPEGIPGVDILDPNAETNPVADWDHVYLPYCDGSFFAGDATHDDNINDKGPREHRGLANLTGALEVAAQRFPSPRRILLAGSSGGAYGLLLAAPLTRHYFPDAELIVMADSGIGLAHDGDPTYIQTAIDEFNLERFIPADCDECVTSGHLTALVGWYLERDPGVRFGLYSSWHDSVLASTFLQVPRADFAAALRSETDALHAAYPDRFRRFINDGTQHTALLGDPTGIIGTDINAVELPPGALQELMGGDLVIGSLENTTIGDLNMATWLEALIDGDLDVWVDVQETETPPDEG